MTTFTKESVYRSMKRLWKRYARQCRRRNVYWELDLELFQKLTSLACDYCGKPPMQKSRSYTYNGLDRKNNKQGYTKENVTPCCSECNFIKGKLLTHEEMKVVGQALTNYRKVKRG